VLAIHFCPYAAPVSEFGVIPVQQKRPTYASSALRTVGGYVVLLSIASILPAAAWSDGSTWHGWEFLMIGPIGLLQGQLGWYANSLVIAAVIMLVIGHRGIARGLGLGAALLSLNTFTLYSTGTWKDEAGNKMDLERLDIGAYVWFAAIAWVVVSIWLTKKRTETP
jgi:uncharacterized membrane protein